MTRRQKPPTPAPSLYADAYHWQQGEFYPEHHQANVRRLQEKYSDISLSEIDAIYRQACRIDYEVQQQVGTSQLSAQAREKLLDWLEDHFNGFGRAEFLLAIERAESK
jgi:acyl-CoA-binding protein